ncbi:hypothetical protein KFK09_017506 [Dendrobium nobile]|uniref:Glycosyltransferase 61 catalytic domain-containing protein n=1 Tax=Dendrobium nobile TaxID=94219 RepID=A0A8T3B1E3_DENNO|nr:hypothetical protein KFK09_017506 [Dendrobium nobile]
MAAPSSFGREGEKAKLAYEAKLLKGFSRFEPRKLGQALVIGCSMVMVTFFLMLGPSVIPFNKFEGIMNGETRDGDPAFNQTYDLCQQRGDLSSEGHGINHLLCTRNVTEEADMKPVCDFSDKRSDICELKGNIRIRGNSSTFLSEISTSQREQSWTIKPHPRKGDLTALQHVTAMSVKLSSNKEELPSCSINHTIPAIFFSAGGYMGNIFHDFTDILIPLFITSTSFRTEVQFLISNVQPWWLAKYKPYLQQLSKYEVIDFNKIENVHCYPHVIVGLRKHKEMSIDPSRAPNSYSMVDFSQIMKKSYGLERQVATKLGDNQAKKPRLLIIARKFTRSFMNIDEIVRMAEDLGYEAVVAEAVVSSNLVRFSHIVNSCDVIMGVHGAGLTNLVFLPINSVVIQIVPLGGLENIAWIDFGRPAIEMKLRYLQYVISEEESTLIEQFDRDGPVFKDPGSIHRQGWLALRKIYLDHQNVRLDVNRFKSVLIQAIQFLH